MKSHIIKIINWCITSNSKKLEITQVSEQIHYGTTMEWNIMQLLKRI